MSKKTQAKLRWSKFWWGDWQNDASLKMCSYAARGLWIEMLAIMHGSEPQGHLLVNGRSPSPKQLAALTGGAERDVLKLLEELEEAGVFSRNSDGVIYSRRMLRDIAASDAGREHGAAGGNPVLTKRGYEGGLTPPVIEGVKLEAEAEAEEESSSLRSELPPTPRRRVAGSGLSKSQIDDAFETLWVNYPRKVGRGAARKAFEAALRKVGWDTDAILTPLLLATWDEREGGRFIPHASTWLNQERWADGSRTRRAGHSPELPLH